jgi:hypothetical protein
VTRSGPFRSCAAFGGRPDNRQAAANRRSGHLATVLHARTISLPPILVVEGNSASISVGSKDAWVGAKRPAAKPAGSRLTTPFALGAIAALRRIGVGGILSAVTGCGLIL